MYTPFFTHCQLLYSCCVPSASPFVQCPCCSPASFDNIRTKWFPEIKASFPNVPIVLVGTKMDLRTSPDSIATLAKEGKAPITTAQGQALAAELTGICKYLECSALTQHGLKAVFDSAIQVAMEAKAAPPKDAPAKKKGCEIV